MAKGRLKENFQTAFRYNQYFRRPAVGNSPNQTRKPEMTKQIAILPGDGIGPEITAQAVRVLDKLISDGLDARYEYAPLGGAAYDQ